MDDTRSCAPLPLIGAALVALVYSGCAKPPKSPGTEPATAVGDAAPAAPFAVGAGQCGLLLAVSGMT